MLTQLLAMLGLEETSNHAQAIFNACVRDDQPALALAHSPTTTAAGHQRQLTIQVKRADGSAAWFEIRTFVEVDPATGAPVCVRGMAMDVTTRKVAEDKLRSSEAMHRLLLETAPDAILVIDAQGVIEFLHRPHFQLTPDAAVGKQFLDLWDAPARASITAAMQQARQSTGGAISDCSRTQDGAAATHYQARIRQLPSHTSAPQFLVVASDITEHQRAKEMLLLSDRMASMGLMAAGIAHEINNPLTSVVANLELALADVSAAKGGQRAGCPRPP